MSQDLPNNSTISEKLETLRQFRGKALWTSLATLIDGEGCINLARQVKNLPRPRYFIRIEIVNTNEAYLQAWMQRIGKGFVNAQRDGNEKHSTSYRWCIVKVADIVYVLKKVLPYLLIKKEQAVISLDLREGKFVKGEKPNEQELARRERLYQRMRILNFRGPSESVEHIRRVSNLENDMCRAVEPSTEQDANVLVQ